ncbi:hypothetical protein M231_04033 [Tremella mesenterica]|uniref:Methyltransferase type 11 domain-containing protein n=1 Tax=Tremella mesenterica TaxID=5217 RepID=A0A4Q1BLQ0_TREME|nr:hypothetical protein M231_04033 [Tremella mesenterica]
MSTYSLHSSVETRVFRQDLGRLYQAHNAPSGDLASPIFLATLTLDAQHYGFKARQAGKNYWAPFPEVLPDGGRGKRILDIGTGTGVWSGFSPVIWSGLIDRAIEIAQEFPNAEVIGLDLAPVQKDQDVPFNCQFIIEDAARGIPFPDGYFDIVHARVLIVGVRNWKSLIDDMVRVTRPGGLIVSVEMIGRFVIDGLTIEEQRRLVPGIVKWSDYLSAALDNRGLDSCAGRDTVPRIMRNHPQLGDVEIAYCPIPLWPWSDDPHLKHAGEVMLADTVHCAETTRLLVVDGCGIPGSVYDQVPIDFQADIGKPEAHCVLPAWHNWAFKLSNM